MTMTHATKILVLVLAASGTVACSEDASVLGAPIIDPPKIPLPQLTVDLYLDQFEGGLYPDQVNVMPARHYNTGVQRAQGVQPRDAGGAPNPNGKYVLLSIGGANATQEFCSPSSMAPCDPWTFMGSQPPTRM